MADMTINELADSGTLEVLEMSNGQPFDIFELGGNVGPGGVFNAIFPEGLRIDAVFGTPEVDGGIVIPPEPVVTISPEAGEPMSSGTPWVATISGEDVSEILVWVSYSDLNLVEVAFDGSDFTPNFKALSSRTVLSEAVQRMTVKRSAGWPSAPRFFIRVRNIFGGVNS